MPVELVAGNASRIGHLRPLFAFGGPDLGLACRPVRCYEVAPDGQRFYAVQSRPSPRRLPVMPVNVILNWSEELKTQVWPGR